MHFPYAVFQNKSRKNNLQKKNVSRKAWTSKMKARICMQQVICAILPNWVSDVMSVVGFHIPVHQEGDRLNSCV